ncbi:MAG: hypothetical protein RBR28_07615 [Lentimicrobium sp.]|jgi:hypothetical protein|nr:hypothetical protein [Lentimicrobium sp.]
MEKYINQLIEDMRLSALKVPSAKDWLSQMNAIHDEPMDEISSCEVFTERSSYKLLGDIVGIPKEALPSPGQLSDAQVKLIHDELEKMLITWHFIPSPPEDVPLKVRYELLRDALGRENCYMGIGEVHMDFCGGNCPDCRVLEYCKTGQGYKDF